jgi:hypothetical protein
MSLPGLTRGSGAPLRCWGVIFFTVTGIQILCQYRTPGHEGARRGLNTRHRYGTSTVAQSGGALQDDHPEHIALICSGAAPGPQHTAAVHLWEEG